MNKTQFGISVALIFGGAFLRLIPHPSNFTPILAIALFAGAEIRSRWLAILIPIVAMFLSDLILGFHTLQVGIYVLMAGITLLGVWLQGREAPLRIANASIVAAVGFFILSNIGVWIWGGLYPLTMAGLSACFVAAIPFFPQTLASTLFYSLILFGALRLSERAFHLARPTM